ncbi:MAG: hypothetical protein ACK5GD_13690, partial [Planctomycetota bacterium]
YCATTVYCSTAVPSRWSTSSSLVSFLEPSDAPRKLGTGTIEDNRRTILCNGCPLFNGCPQPLVDKL